MAGACLGLILLVAGCVNVPVGVSNPVPGLTTVAVAPFFNLSSEPTADGRRVALAYYAELQKQAGFQVIPVGVVEEALRQSDLELSNPADAVRLAEILGADAIVVGAITDYTPYYPPQIGLQVQWYSPREWLFYPGPMPRLRGELTRNEVKPSHTEACDVIIRGQSGSELTDEELDALIDVLDSVDADDVQLVQNRGGSSGKAEPGIWPLRVRGQPPAGGAAEGASGGGSAARGGTADAGNRGDGAKPGSTNGPGRPAKSGRGGRPDQQKSPAISVAGGNPAGQPGRPGTGPAEAVQAGNINGECLPPQSGDNRPPSLEPLMSYTRFFDGADPELVKLLKAYRTYRGDMRSGGWEAYLHRSDDFLRFTAHVMIVEMLTLHGGTLRTEKVFPNWK